MLESLERLGVDTVDVYLLHRDNADVPVGEFMEVLDRHHRAGRIKCFGGSNWSLSRVKEANAYAEANGLAKMSVVSNQFSLARLMNPTWPGCLTSGTDEYRAWHEATQTPLLAWSSQARGFFAEGAPSADRIDGEMKWCWACDANFARRERARELAKARGVVAINVALAYVLAQPFPALGLIGPRTLEEMRIAWRALEVKLTPAEVAWLDTGEGERPS